MLLHVSETVVKRRELGASWDRNSVLFNFLLQGKQKEAEQARIRFAGDTRSDHIALLNAFQVITVHVLSMCVSQRF